MTEPNEVQRLRALIAPLRITLGLILLVTWYDNLNKGLYTADGITGLFNYIFDDAGGGAAWYRALVESTILQAPGAFASFQLVAELLLGLGLFFGALTPIAGISAALFFFNLFLSYYGGHEWIWTYVLLTVSALVVGLSHSGRAFGLDQYLLKIRGEPPYPFLW